MKNNKIIKYIMEVIPFIIAFVVEDNVGNYLGLNTEKILSMDTGLSLIIFVIAYVIANVFISKITDKGDKKTNTNPNISKNINKNTNKNK